MRLVNLGTRLVVATLAMGMLASCGGEAAPTKESCAAICADGSGAEPGTPVEAPPAGASLSGFEDELFKPLLADVRSGVRPFTDQGIGICKGERACDEWVGTDVGELPPGKYIVKAELRVPDVGEPGTWKVTFDTECTTTKTTSNGESSSTSNSSRGYDVRYAGADRGYRLMPLRTIESPSKGGKRACTWKITAPHPDGDKVYTGSWSTPEKG